MNYSEIYQQRFKKPVERFMEKMMPVTESGCWLWIGPYDKDEYGLFKVSGKMMRAHRFSYSHFVRPLNLGEWVLHRCDVSSCVNPNHLFIGDNETNQKDLTNKWKQNFCETHPNTRFTWTKIKYIRMSAKTRAELAREFNVSWTCINSILKLQTWKPENEYHQ